MSETVLLYESLRLMLIGMGIVFSFLLLLVGILRLMSWTALRLAPLPQTEPAALSAAPGSGDGAPIAVIAAAIARYRAGRRR
ncbi:MAG: sodium pump decarboxylase subunit gamma [Gammaproteobacteria bacterium]|jgi:oxaloacetate decarboxylase gamma subunit|nr:sodium pump decarboxylase subunit gamma [Gammaproteobacteria bacterium]